MSLSVWKVMYYVLLYWVWCQISVLFAVRRSVTEILFYFRFSPPGGLMFFIGVKSWVFMWNMLRVIPNLCPFHSTTPRFQDKVLVPVFTTRWPPVDSVQNVTICVHIYLWYQIKLRFALRRTVSKIMQHFEIYACAIYSRHDKPSNSNAIASKN